jgi:predicted nucleic acid-binding protein
MTAALDTSVAIALLVRSHEFHEHVSAALPDQLVLTGHSAAETYSVLTRLPGDGRLIPSDAAQLLSANFGPTALLPARLAKRVPSVLADLGIAGGQVYDALVALAAREAGLTLLTIDARATSTYAAVGVDFDIVPTQ